MTDGIMIEAKKDGLRQNQDGLWKLSLTVKDMPAELLSAPMGQRLACVVVALKDNEEAKPGQIFPEGYTAGSKPKEKSEAQKAVTRAVMLCDDKQFQHWILGGGIKHAHDLTADEAAAALRIKLGIESRRDIAADPAALERFLDLETQFRYRDSRR